MNECGWIRQHQNQNQSMDVLGFKPGRLNGTNIINHFILSKDLQPVTIMK